MSLVAKSFFQNGVNSRQLRLYRVDIYNLKICLVKMKVCLVNIIQLCLSIGLFSFYFGEFSLATAPSPNIGTILPKYLIVQVCPTEKKYSTPKIQAN